MARTLKARTNGKLGTVHAGSKISCPGCNTIQFIVPNVPVHTCCICKRKVRVDFKGGHARKVHLAAT
jgi:hypothetical protein